MASTVTLDAVSGTVSSTTAAEGGSWTWKDTCRTIVSIVGIIGNSLVIAVYTSKKKRNSTTNVLMLALACADLISSLFFLPLPTASYVPRNAWGEIYCRIIFNKSIQWISIESSVYTLTLLSVERFMAVVHPVRYRVIFSGSRPKRFVLIIWFFAVILKSFNFYNTIIENDQCVYIKFPKGFDLLIAIGVIIIEYIFPICVMVVTNIITIRALRYQARNLQEHSSNMNARERGPAKSVLKTRRNMIHVVLIVIITFIICWTPNQISLLLINIDVLSVEYFNGDIHQTFIILAFTNSCANPIIYTFKNKNFRVSMLQLFTCKPNRVGEVSMGTDIGHNVTTGGSDPTRVIHVVSKRTSVTMIGPQAARHESGNIHSSQEARHESGIIHSAQGVNLE